MVFLRGLIESTLSPVGLMVVLLASGIALSLFERKRRLGHRLVLGGALLYLTFTFVPVADLLTASLERRYPPLLEPDGIVEYVAVLSGYAEEHAGFPVTSNIRDETIFRLVEGIRIHRQIPGSKLVLSGGVAQRGGRPLAVIMADFAAGLGVPPQEIVVEGRSRNTYENLVEIGKIVGEKRFVLVTSAYHVPRAMAVARKLGLNAIAGPAQIWAWKDQYANRNVTDWARWFAGALVRPSHKRLLYLQWSFHEYAGLAWYRWQGRL